MTESTQSPPAVTEKPIATVTNNNQPGWQNIVETEPRVTLDVGTELFTREQVEKMLVQLRDGVISDV